MGTRTLALGLKPVRGTLRPAQGRAGGRWVWDSAGRRRRLDADNNGGPDDGDGNQ
jgi:hypothetical protein